MDWSNIIPIEASTSTSHLMSTNDDSVNPSSSKVTSMEVEKVVQGLFVSILNSILSDIMCRLTCYYECKFDYEVTLPIFHNVQCGYKIDCDGSESEILIIHIRSKEILYIIQSN